MLIPPSYLSGKTCCNKLIVAHIAKLNCIAKFHSDCVCDLTSPTFP